MKDLDKTRETLLNELFTGLQEYGFVVLRDHAIDRQRLDHAYQLLERLFALPVEAKLKYDRVTVADGDTLPLAGKTPRAIPMQI